ncbi:hypothetical protein [Companilactobacillus ginsenosidimutans]|uniref:Uncharacterized protein n=1 Tax=Companilactobacillus ginsenosidimutans TaxID=1007676 RepID=A0A0H4QF15_9LACO|nr:hypothetical protein [Companilactobacillus ginsenosidimutans]AKP66964.1 hypothetical protein ABM34_05060 [Companilactobacillus ginsenosidimutans]
MDKKLLIGLGLSVVTGGVAVLGLFAFKTVRKFKVKRERKQLKRLIKKHLNGNEKALAIVDGLSNFEIRILFKIVEKATEKISDIKLPAALSDKISSIAEG